MNSSVRLTQAERSLLVASRLFMGISDEELPHLLSCLSARISSFLPDDYLLLEGGPVIGIGIILAGEAQVIQEDWNGYCSILSLVSAGDPFGESFSCAQLDSNPVSVQALTAGKALWLEYENIIRPCSSACSFHLRLLSNMLLLLAGKNLSLQQKLTHLSKRRTRDKILSYLEAQAKLHGKRCFSIPLNRQQLADYLYVNRSALSSELIGMQKEGLLHYSRNKFTLVPHMKFSRTLDSPPLSPE